MADNYFPTPNVPTNNNPGQIAKTPVLNPPAAGSNMGVDLSRTSLRNPVPSGAGVGNPMDSAPTCPAVSRKPPSGSPN